MSEDATAQFKRTWQTEVEFAERDENGDARLEKIEVPWVSSDQFFEITNSPELAKFFESENRTLTGKEANEFLSILGKILVNLLVPGVLKKLTPSGGFKLIGEILQKEGKTFGLGGAKKNQ